MSANTHSLRRSRLRACAVITLRIAALVSCVVLSSVAPIPFQSNPTTLLAQRNPIIRRADLPAGLGIARVTPASGSVLHFYRPPRIGESPGDYPPSDTVKFSPGKPSVEIGEAPPWLVPDQLKMDYEIFYLRVVTLTRDWVEVIGNSSTGETTWVSREAVSYTSWPEFLLEVHSVEAFDPEASPVRARPLDSSPILSTARAALAPLAIQGEWMKVDTNELADRIQPEGWIRWRRGDRLLVTYNPLS